MTGDPFPNTPSHHVLMSHAFGDHQVSNWAAAVEARTSGARLRTPALDTFRDPTAGYRYFGEIRAIKSYPYDGSAITLWDSGPIQRQLQRRNSGAPAREPAGLRRLPGGSATERVGWSRSARGVGDRSVRRSALPFPRMDGRAVR
jgi:hypothetical protein